MGPVRCWEMEAGIFDRVLLVESCIVSPRCCGRGGMGMEQNWKAEGSRSLRRFPRLYRVYKGVQWQEFRWKQT